MDSLCQARGREFKSRRLRHFLNYYLGFNCNLEWVGSSLGIILSQTLSISVLSAYFSSLLKRIPEDFGGMVGVSVSAVFNLMTAACAGGHH